MTSITNITRDDAAIHIDSKGTTRTVKPIEPYPEVQPVTERPEEQKAKKPAREKQQRRDGDRRQQDEPILLDTRDGHGRRKADHPADSDEAVEVARIDIFT